MGSATTENTDVHHGGVGNGNSDSSGHHVHRNCTGGGGYGGETTVGQGETDCNNQNALNRPTDETFRKEKAAADGAKTEGDANTGGLKLSHTADCSKCKGSGNIPAPRNEEGGGYCTRCAGARFVEEEEKLVLSIPAGVEKGQTEVYKDKGHVDLAGEKYIPRSGLEHRFLPTSSVSKPQWYGYSKVALDVGRNGARVYNSRSINNCWSRLRARSRLNCLYITQSRVYAWSSAHVG